MLRTTQDDFQRGFQLYLMRVKAGETTVIESDGKPVAEVKPIVSEVSSNRRPAGLCKGEFRVPDDFDAPLPEALLRTFGGKDH